MYPLQTKSKFYGNQNNDLIEEVVSKSNILKALRQIEKRLGYN